MRKVLTLAGILTTSMLLTAFHAQASGKQFRPPKIDICKVSPDSEKCKEKTNSTNK